MSFDFLTVQNQFQADLIKPAVTPVSYTPKKQVEDTNPYKAKTQTTQKTSAKEDSSTQEKDTSNVRREQDFFSILKGLHTEESENEVSAVYHKVAAAPKAETDSSEDTDMLSEEDLALSKLALGSEEIEALLEKLQSLIDKLNLPKAESKDVLTADAQTSVSDALQDVDLKAIIEQLVFLLKTGGDQDSLQSIQDLLNSSQKALLANLTPEDITNLQQATDDILNETASQEDYDLLATFAQSLMALSAVPERKIADTAAAIRQSVQSLPKMETDDAPSENSESATLPSSNALPEKSAAQSRYDARYEGRYDLSEAMSDESQPADEIDFKALLKDTAAKSMNNATMEKNATPSAALRPAQMAGLEGMTFSAGTLTTSAQSTGSTQSVPVSYQGTPTSLLTQTYSATASHPATQSVVATIQKAVKDGDSTNIKLNLDPPELGRVEVKMSIDKNNATKIVLTVEKPETYTMLQRDSHILQRALQDAGLDAQNGLSFELASDNGGFANDNSRGGGHDRGGAGYGGAADEDGTILESSMGWRVDPRTGTMHYNVLV